jgi:dTDP-4-amino-4,6-dideoxygalactose transaminase
VKVFDKSFTQQEPIDESAIAAAVDVMRSGRLHRYNTTEGESGETDLLEAEFADYLGAPYCLACASGGYAIHVALRAVGVQPGDVVLSNAFTLAPVPGAVHNSGAVPVLVEVDDDCCIDLDDLEAKATGSQAKFLLLSHMRGHMADMDRIVVLCERAGLCLIEDCAHTMGASWNGQKSGSFGQVACFSTQTYKHLNSGEGGLLTSHDPDVMARAIVMSGSYRLFDRHVASPPDAAFAAVADITPNYSGRMDNLRAAILRPQLADLDARCEGWTQRYRIVEAAIGRCPSIRLPVRPPAEKFVGSSIQFSLPGFDADQVRQVVDGCLARGVELKWFGAPQPTGYTSRYDSWRYLPDTSALPQTDRVLATLLDMRIPLTFTDDDCRLIGEVIVEVVSESHR